MRFWSFIRDMIVLDWLSGKHRDRSCEESHLRDNQRFDDSYDDDFCGGYHGYDATDCAQQDFFASEALWDDDDDFDSGTYDDLDSDLFDDDF